jgi:hypothetical protein
MIRAAWADVTRESGAGGSDISGSQRSTAARIRGVDGALALAWLVVLVASGCAVAPAGTGSSSNPAVAGHGPGEVQMHDAAAATLTRLRWLQGCWLGTLDGGATYEEIWMSPLGGTMLGMARMSHQGRTVSFEFMRIEDDGQTARFQAQPAGRPATEFREVESGPGSVVFANDGHDFPQRVRYRLVPPDSLHAAIEGTMGEQSRSFHFPLARSSCPGPEQP